VRFAIKDPLAIHFSDCQSGNCQNQDWTPVGTVDAQVFPQLAELAPGQSVDVFVAVTPPASPTPPQNALTGSAAIQVSIDAVQGEISLGNNVTEVAVQRLETVVDPSPDLDGLGVQSLVLRNDSQTPRTFGISTQSNLPPGLAFSFGQGEHDVTLDAFEVRAVPLQFRFDPQQGSLDRYVAANRYLLNADVGTVLSLINPAIVPGSAFEDDAAHPDYRTIGTGTFAVNLVKSARLGISVAYGRQNRNDLEVSGGLQPAHPGAWITVDYTDANGRVISHLVETNHGGRFTDRLVGFAGPWKVRALWQGDLDHAAASSREATVGTRDPFGDHGND